MSRRTRATRARTKTPSRSSRFKPKAGPGGVYVEELVSAKTGRDTRFRNIGEHPLTLAYAKGRISADQFAAGEELRLLCELRSLSGRDSTVLSPGGGYCADVSFTQSQVEAMRRLGRIRDQLKKRDWIILEKLCGEGWPMAEAVRAATVCHPSGVLQRVHEALDELIEVRGHRLRSATSA
jgi:hypothetical protein